MWVFICDKDSICNFKIDQTKFQWSHVFEMLSEPKMMVVIWWFGICKAVEAFIWLFDLHSFTQGCQHISPSQEWQRWREAAQFYPMAKWLRGAPCQNLPKGVACQSAQSVWARQEPGRITGPAWPGAPSCPWPTAQLWTGNKRREISYKPSAPHTGTRCAHLDSPGACLERLFQLSLLMSHSLWHCLFLTVS